MKRITDPTFVYRNSASTDIAKTFAKERRRLAKLEELKAKFNNVQPIKREVSK